jgi:hypothetical protein
MKEVPQAVRAHFGEGVPDPEGAAETYDLFGPVGPHDVLPPWIFLPRLLQGNDLLLSLFLEILHGRLLDTPVGDRGVERIPSRLGLGGPPRIP